MKYVMLIYLGPMPTVPGSDRWKALPEAEQKQIYADYAEVTKAPGVTPGLPLGLPNASRTVQVRRTTRGQEWNLPARARRRIPGARGRNICRG